MGSLTAEERTEALAGFDVRTVESLLWDWAFWARSSQLPPAGEWFTWLLMSGRGFGKTWTGAEMTCEEAKTGRSPRMILVGRTASDVRDTMVEGPAGVLSVSPPWFRPTYEPTKRRLTWPNGTVALLLTADEPNEIRGKEAHFAWADELASWRFAEAWENLLFGVRVGQRPRIIATTTPKPIRLIRNLVKDSSCVVTRGSTYENIENLSPVFIRQVVDRLRGTRIGRQELGGELLEDNPDALWTPKKLEETRVTSAPDLGHIVVGVDPSVSAGEDSSEAGVVCAGWSGDLHDGHGYVLEDASLRGTPHDWATAVVAVYHKWRANEVVAEVNNGGDMVEAVIKAIDPSVPVTKVHASRGKAIRAEPIATLYEQDRVHHVGFFPALEDELTDWSPHSDYSPNRLDALVWAVTQLAYGTRAEYRIL